MKITLLVITLLFCSQAYSKSYFVKFENYDALNTFSATEAFDKDIKKIRSLNSNIAAFAVLETELSQKN